MKYELKQLIQYRLLKAKESLEEANILAETGHWNASVNRLYYSCFYAVAALLSQRNLSFSKHSGVRSCFNQYFVKTGEVEKETALIYNSLYERRQEADYEAFVTFKETDVKAWIKDAALFITAINKLIEKE